MNVYGMARLGVLLAQPDMDIFILKYARTTFVASSRRSTVMLTMLCTLVGSRSTNMSTATIPFVRYASHAPIKTHHANIRYAISSAKGKDFPNKYREKTFILVMATITTNDTIDIADSIVLSAFLNDSSN